MALINCVEGKRDARRPIKSLNLSIDVCKAETSAEIVCRVAMRESDIGMGAHIRLDGNAPMDDVFNSFIISSGTSVGRVNKIERRDRIVFRKRRVVFGFCSFFIGLRRASGTRTLRAAETANDLAPCDGHGQRSCRRGRRAQRSRRLADNSAWRRPRSLPLTRIFVWLSFAAAVSRRPDATRCAHSHGLVCAVPRGAPPARSPFVWHSSPALPRTTGAP